LLIAGSLPAANQLQVNSAAAMNGSNFGLEVVVDGTTSKAFVQDDSPNGEKIYRFSFYLDTNAVATTSGNTILFGRSSGANAANVIQIFLSPSPRDPGLYLLSAKTLQDNGVAIRSGKVSLGSKPSLIEFEWVAGDGSGNGSIRMWRNGNLKASRTNIANDSFQIDEVRLGVPKGVPSDTIGSFYLDEFQSFRSLAP
jgi:hypothetical protein